MTNCEKEIEYDYIDPVKESIKDFMVENIVRDYMGGAEYCRKGLDRLSPHGRDFIMDTYGITKDQLVRVITAMGVN